MSAAAPLLGVGTSDVDDLAARGAGPMLSALARAVQDDLTPRRVWLLLAVLAGGLPTPTMLMNARRELTLARPSLAYRAFLGAIARQPGRFDERPLDLIVGGVVVDVDFSARFAHNTGIQRVARQTASRWAADHDVVLSAWEADGTAMRPLSVIEHERVVDWPNRRAASTSAKSRKRAPRLLIPIDSHVIVTEVPGKRASAALAAMAEAGANDVGLIGYDTIPISSAHTVPLLESNKFVEYLSLVKQARHVACISKAAAVEFGGYCHALRAQGLTGPRITAVSLPVDYPDSPPVNSPTTDGPPSVLCVGSQEERKNQFAVLMAAETLWQEGLSFSLEFVGAGSLTFTRLFDKAIRRLARRGRPVAVTRGMSDAALGAAYRRARFTVFPSLHEGYGLPVAESLAYGVPVVTTNYGSTLEIGAAGGCLLVDPRNQGELEDAMRELLVSDDAVQALRTATGGRPSRTWDDYATQLWGAFMGSEAD